MSRIAQLFRYVSKVYHVRDLLKGVQDTRDVNRVQIPTTAVITGWMLAFWARVRSREQIGRCLDRRAVHKLVGSHISSDTLGRVLNQVDPDSVRTQLLVPLVRQMRRNKAWQHGSVAGHMLIGIDGSEAFCSKRQHCPECLSRELQLHGETVTEYYHRAVWAFIIGTEPKVFLDVEVIRPGEGESIAAARLVSRLREHYGRWIHGVVVDAGFANAPFLNHVREMGLHYVVRIKQESRLLIRAAQRHFASRAPDVTWEQRIGHHRLRIHAWDQTTALRWYWRKLDHPVRVVACDELELAEVASRRRKSAQPERQRSRAFFATSFPRQMLSTEAVCSTYHQRWDIENCGIRQLKHEWHWNHPFVHTPDALAALWLILAVAANLFVAFVTLRLAETRSGTLPKRAVAEQILAELLCLGVAGMPTWDSS